MDRTSKPAVEPRTERRAMIALVAVFALLVQALVPAIANAAPRSGGEQVICNGYGLQTISLDDAEGGKRSSAAPCEQCVCPPLGIETPATTAPAVVVAYAREAAPEAARPDLPPPARAPPRPPGQGPPTADA